MKLQRITALYFSPTGGTRRIAHFLAEDLARRLALEARSIDLTGPEARKEDRRFHAEELVLAAVPVYAGRIPNKLLPDLERGLAGGGAPAIPVCVFGNRSPGGAVWELDRLLAHRDFRPIGAAAFACRHAFSDRVGTGRPDEADWAQIREFSAQAADRLSGDGPPLLLDPEQGEVGPYYVPLRQDGSPAQFLKARPLTARTLCTQCGACAAACPMGSIDAQTMEAAGICIKCQACVRRCPTGAKYFADRDFLSHVAMLEQNYRGRAENVTYFPRISPSRTGR